MRLFRLGCLGAVPFDRGMDDVQKAAKKEEDLMKRTILGFSLMFAFVCLSGTAFAQLKFGTDFTASDAVWSVTHIKVKEVTPIFRTTYGT